MKHQHCFSDHYKALNVNFQKHYAKTVLQHEAKNIHQLRVTIKKIKAFFNLIEYVCDEFDAAVSFHSYKKIFKEAGKVRDLHVRLLLLKNLERELKISLPVQERELKVQEKKEYKSFRKHFSRMPHGFHRSINKQVIHILKKDFSTECSRQYLLKQLKKIANRMKEHDESFKDLHKIRILLKDYLYNIRLVNDCVLKNKAITKHVNMLSTLQDLIGKWHDQATMLRFVSDQEHNKHFSMAEIKGRQIFKNRLHKSTIQLAAHLRKRFPAMLANFKTIQIIL